MSKQLVFLQKSHSSRVYITTLQQATQHKGLFPTRKSFGQASVCAFGGSKVSYFATCEEEHADGNVHYHCSLKLVEPCRWGVAKKYLSENFGVNVNFSLSPEEGGGYIPAYRYICKEDKNVFHGSCLERHPDFKMLG